MILSLQRYDSQVKDKDLIMAGTLSRNIDIEKTLRMEDRTEMNALRFRRG